VDKADAFIACTNGDNTNLMVVQMARELFGVSASRRR
jgi:Trk K+ transport system NAD-binding subunit